jgi:hypothetical protein
MEDGYKTLSLYEGAALELLTGTSPTLQRTSKGLLQLSFPKTPEILAAVERWHGGVEIDARTFADMIARNFLFAKSWREMGR